MSPEQKEQLRHAALEYLVAQHPLKRTVGAVRRWTAREVGCVVEDADVKGALALLEGMSPALVASSKDDLGQTEFWQATSAGVLFVERGGAAQ